MYINQYKCITPSIFGINITYYVLHKEYSEYIYMILYYYLKLI